MNKTISKRQTKEKELLIEQLKKIPIVQVACEKLSIGRATYYRWRKEDKDFAKQADTALEESSLLINDVAESQLISEIKNKNITAIIFWLKHHHKAYANRLALTGHLRHEYQLTVEQEKLIERALAMVTKGDIHATQ